MTFHLFCLGRVAPVVHDRILASLRTIGTPTRRTGALTRVGQRSGCRDRPGVELTSPYHDASGQASDGGYIDVDSIYGDDQHERRLVGRSRPLAIWMQRSCARASRLP
jgi:hypothetical protein